MRFLSEIPTVEFSQMMVKTPEKVRLLLVNKNTDETPQKRYFRGKNCLIISLLQALGALVMIPVVVFIAYRVVQIQKDMKRKEKPGTNVIPGSDFCKSLNAENMSLVALGYLTGIKEVHSVMESKNKIYYLTDRLFSDQEACAIEAVLRLLQDKSIFVIEIGNVSLATNHSQTDYVGFLRSHYTNLNRVKSTRDTFFKGSPFQNKFKSTDDFWMYAAKVLLVWQFGGTVLSPNFLLLTRRLFDLNEGFCEVDRELLFCPNQCSAYVYQLVKTILDTLQAHNETQPAAGHRFMQELVDKSVSDYCGSVDATAIGCIGVNRIKEYKVCQKLHPDCDYVRVQQWKIKDPNWKSVVHKFCPKMVTQYEPELASFSGTRRGKTRRGQGEREVAY